jgi:glycosyltransferase involved in cell wall biosynthesis
VWTVPTADPAALASAIEHLVDRPRLRAALAAAGQQAYDERFAREVLGRRLQRRLSALVSAHPSDGRSFPSGSAP